MTEVVFYVSGHGYGHAVRIVEVIRSLREVDSCFRVCIRTSVPKEFFSAQSAGSENVQHAYLDSGVVEENQTLFVDSRATVERLASFLRQREHIIGSEVDFLQHEQPILVVADIPYLAGDLADVIGVPCIGIGNFTWDWIYEPYLQYHEESERLLECIRQGYSKMHTYLRLPFSHDVSVFRHVSDVPLITRRSQRPHEEVLRRLGADPRDSRTRVMIGMRGNISIPALAAAAKHAKDFLFLCLGVGSRDLPRNARHVVLGPDLSFPDVLSVCDIVVSKLGYGILADSIACQTGILFPPRTGFREDGILRASACRYVKASEIPLPRFLAGDWLEHLRRLRDSPAPLETMETNGAQVCAEIIAEHLATSGRR